MFPSRIELRNRIGRSKTEFVIHSLKFSVVLAGVLCALTSTLSAADAPTPKPNILLIFADDLGWSDLGCYGGEIRTPTLDVLAKGGLRFTQFYNSARCSPSRAALLTGLHPHQAGVPNLGGHLNDRCLTLAEALAPAGYDRFMSGKWHVGQPGPIERGFQEFYGFVEGHSVDCWDEDAMVRLPAGRPKRPYPPGTFYATDAITDHA